MAPCHVATPAQTYYGSPVSWKNTGMLAGVTDCRRNQKWGCRGRLALGFKPRRGSPARRGPCGFGGVGGEDHAALAEWGPSGGDTADGARSLNHGLLLLFLRYSTPDWAEGEGRTVCVYGYSKGLQYFNEDIKSLL